MAEYELWCSQLVTSSEKALLLPFKDILHHVAVTGGPMCFGLVNGNVTSDKIGELPV